MADELDRRSLLVLPAMGLAALSGCIPMSMRKESDLVQSLDREVIALQQENARLRKQLERCDTDGRPPPEIYTELRQILGGREDASVSRTDRVTRVTLAGASMFAPGSTRLRAEAEAVMDLLSTALNLHTQTFAMVVGHTDDQPTSGRLKRTYPTNWELSTARAAAVVRSLSEEWGVSPHRFTAGGRAEWHPIADNATAEGREINRRVEVLIFEEEPP
jgi:chemotaxis protein MotB